MRALWPHAQNGDAVIGDGEKDRVEGFVAGS